MDRDTLTIEKRLKSFDGAAYSGVLCSDGEQLANVCKTEEVFFYSFVNHNTNYILFIYILNRMNFLHHYSKSAMEKYAILMSVD